MGGFYDGLCDEEDVRTLTANPLLSRFMSFLPTVPCLPARLNRIFVAYCKGSIEAILISYYIIQPLLYNPVAYKSCTHSILLLHHNTLPITRSISTRLSLSGIKGLDCTRMSQ